MDLGLLPLVKKAIPVADFGLYVMAAPPRFSMDTKHDAVENVAPFKYDVILGHQFAKFPGAMYLKVRFWQVEVLELWSFEKNQESLKKNTFKTLMVGKNKFVSLVETFVTRHL